MLKVLLRILHVMLLLHVIAVGREDFFVKL